MSSDGMLSMEDQKRERNKRLAARRKGLREAEKANNIEAYTARLEKDKNRKRMQRLQETSIAKSQRQAADAAGRRIARGKL
jgi:hypothetical protein